MQTPTPLPHVPTSHWSLLFVWVGALVYLFILIATSLPTVPGRDASIFMYVGQGILEGAWPYTDRWDHKPPGIYALNAVGLWISNGKLWGIWLLESLNLVLSMGILWRLISISAGVLSAGLALCAFLLGFYGLYSGGNLTEEFALLPQIGALYLFINQEQTPLVRTNSKWSLSAIGIGILGGCAFLLKPTMVGVWVMIGILWAFRLGSTQRSHYLSNILSAVLGGGSTLAVAVLPFVWNGNFDTLFDAAISFNFSYAAESSWVDRITVIKDALRHALLFPLLLVCWLLSICVWAVQLKQAKTTHVIVRVAVILLPIELVLATVSGRTYEHYYLPLLTSTALLTALAVYYVGYGLQQLASSMGSAALTRGFLFGMPLLAVSVLLSMLVPTRWLLIDQLNAGVTTKEKNSQIIADYVQRNTQEGDTILVWGAEAQIYLLAGRQAAMPMLYQYPLATPGYANAALGETFLAQLTASCPALIIDSHNEYMPPLDVSNLKKWRGPGPGYAYSPDVFLATINMINRAYTRSEQVAGYDVYHRLSCQ